jgi:spore germination protein
MNRAVVRAAIAVILTGSLAIAGLVATQSASADTAPRRIVNGWLPHWSMSASLNAVTANADLWGEASPFWYQAIDATTITPQTGAGDPMVVAAQRTAGIAVVPTVTESLNAAAMAQLLGDSAQRAAHVAALVDLLTADGFDGISARNRPPS